MSDGLDDTTDYEDPEHPAHGAEDALPRSLQLVGKALAVVAGTAIVGLMTVTVVDICLRQTGHPGISGVIEWTEVLLVAVVVTGLMSAEISRVHVRTELLTGRLSPLARHLVRGLGLAVATLFFLWFVYATFQAGMDSFRLREVRPGVSQVPIWPAKLAIPVGLLGLTLVLVARAGIDLRLAYRILGGRRAERADSGHETRDKGQS